MTIYTTTTCPHCRVLKKYCDANNIAFIEKNTDTDEEALADIIGEGFSSVPVVKFSGRYMLIHSVEEFKEFIGK